MTNRIVYMRWGDRYTLEHENALKEQVKRNCSVDFEFCNMEDIHIGQDCKKFQQIQDKTFRGSQDPESSITDHDQQKYVREDAGGLAHFRKYIMWSKDEHYFDEDDVILYLDLDTIITGDLAYFFNLDMEKPYIAKSYQFYKDMKWNRLYNLRSCPYFNSSVVVWKTGQCRKIINQLRNTAEQAFFQYGINDNWLFHRFGPYCYDNDNRNFFNHFDEGIVVSEGDLQSWTIVHTLAGMNMNEKNKICLQ